MIYNNDIGGWWMEGWRRMEESSHVLDCRVARRVCIRHQFPQAAPFLLPRYNPAAEMGGAPKNMEDPLKCTLQCTYGVRKSPTP